MFEPVSGRGNVFDFLRLCFGDRRILFALALFESKIPKFEASFEDQDYVILLKYRYSLRNRNDGLGLPVSKSCIMEDMNLSPVKSGNVEALLIVYLFLGEILEIYRYVMTKIVPL